MSNITVQSPLLQGWTSSPNVRGSIDILSSCIFTIFICIWSVLCVNIRPGGTLFEKIYPKLKLSALTILGPDFLLLLVVGQWESACRSCRRFKEGGNDGWSMRHAYYADMGGFVVQTKDRVSWPLDANQLFYLIEEEWIKKPMLESQILIDRGEIDDRNKQNTLVRILTMGQILWFLINCIARVCQRLAITTLELTTIGFIFTTVAVSICWFHKPADIETRRFIDIDATVAEIHTRAGRDHTYVWYDTPLDFIDPERTYPEVAWRYCLRVLSSALRLSKHRPKPIEVRRDDNFPALSHIGVLIVGMPGLLSWGCNFAAWDFDFPTPLERNAWRVCSSILVAAVFAGEVYHEILLSFFPHWKTRASQRFASSKQSDVIETKPPQTESFLRRLENRRKRIVLRLSNNSVNKDPSLTIELRVLLPALFCSSAYLVARAYLLVEDFIAFRGQNPDVYKLVSWVDFLPHV